MSVVLLDEYMNKKLTIVTPVYLPDKHLFDVCTNSILNQENKDFTWLLGFDGEKSYWRVKHNTELFKVLENSPNIEIHVFKKEGVSKTRNKLLDKVNSGHVLFLDCDNWIHSITVQTLKQVFEHCEANESEFWKSKHFFTFGQVVRTRPEHIKNPHLVIQQFREGNQLKLEKFLFSTDTDLGQICHKVDRDLRFDDNMDRLVDWDYIARMLKNSYSQMKLEFYLSFYDNIARENRISSTKDFKRNRARMVLKFEEEFRNHFKTIGMEKNIDFALEQLRKDAKLQ